MRPVSNNDIPSKTQLNIFDMENKKRKVKELLVFERDKIQHPKLQFYLAVRFYPHIVSLGKATTRNTIPLYCFVQTTQIFVDKVVVNQYHWHTYNHH